MFIIYTATKIGGEMGVVDGGIDVVGGGGSNFCFFVALSIDFCSFSILLASALAFLIIPLSFCSFFLIILAICLSFLIIALIFLASFSSFFFCSCVNNFFLNYVQEKERKNSLCNVNQIKQSLS